MRMFSFVFVFVHSSPNFNCDDTQQITRALEIPRSDRCTTTGRLLDILVKFSLIQLHTCDTSCQRQARPIACLNWRLLVHRRVRDVDNSIQPCMCNVDRTRHRATACFLTVGGGGCDMVDPCRSRDTGGVNSLQEWLVGGDGIARHGTARHGRYIDRHTVKPPLCTLPPLSPPLPVG